VLNHFEIIGVFLARALKFLAQILIVLALFRLNYSWLACLTAKLCTVLESWMF